VGFGRDYTRMEQRDASTLAKGQAKATQMHLNKT